MKTPQTQSVSSVAQRQLATSAAIASVKAEGLTPTTATTQRLAKYVQGTVTSSQLFEQTLAEIKTRNKQTVS